ncbi:PDR/VanB family oxidoreductase [Affinibrenneria salicis]|nr:PDR/VanB family oxidoreductase [Affinibrenneria salicis]
MDTLKVVVDGLYRQGRNNLAVHLVAENDQPLPAWQPGAHIDVHLGNGLIRQYSLTGAATEQDGYLLCVAKESASRGGSRFIHETLRPGQTLTISAPRNVFPLAPAAKVILMAAGIGITPLYAMAEQLEATGTPFELHYYIRQKGNAAFLRELSRPFRHGCCTIRYSCEGHSPRQHIPAGLLAPAPDSHLYLCGPQGFMSHIISVAAANGWPEQNIHAEAFSPVSLPAPENTDETFRVTLASSGQSWSVPADRTIASVLQENGVDVALSCEMGMCGACLTRVKEGAVDHRDTVQSESEKNGPEQQIALCCSRSFTANLVLDL